MTLKDLGEEYKKQSDFIYQQIKELRPRLKKLRGFELMELKRNLNSMYSMAIDCKIIGEDLINYYDVDEDKKSA